MIRDIYQGNLFESATQAICNPCNLQGVMGLGLALAFKQRYPKMFLTYRLHCKRNEFKPGQIQIIEEEDYVIINFPTKDKWGTYGAGSSLELISAGLDKLIMNYKARGITSVTIPPLGCGAGGLSFETDLLPLLKNKLNDCDLIVDIITPY